MGLSGLDYKTAKLIKNKYRVHQCLLQNRVDDTAQTYEIDRNCTIVNLQEEIMYPVMVKPCDGSGSNGANRVDAIKELQEACHLAMDASLTSKAIIEPFIEGKEYGAESLVVNGEIHVLAIMKKQMTLPPHYAELGHAIPCDLPYEVEQKAKQCVKKAIQALRINFGSVNMDVLITKEGNIHIIDVGARMGGNMIGSHIIPYGTGIDYMAEIICSALGEKNDFKKMPSGTVATKLLAFNSGVVVDIPNIQEIEKMYGVEIYHHLKVGEKIRQYKTNLDGCGYIIAKANSVNEAEEKVENAFEHLNKVLFGRNA